jgi:hypothetical protein
MLELIMAHRVRNVTVFVSDADLDLDHWVTVPIASTDETAALRKWKEIVVRVVSAALKVAAVSPANSRATASGNRVIATERLA